MEGPYVSWVCEQCLSSDRARDRATGKVMGGVTVWLSVLGPVRAWRDDVEMDLGTPQQRALLTVLAAHADRPVSLGHLIEGLWGADPPPSAVNLVHRYVGQLRRLLEPGLPTRTAGRLLVGGGGGDRLGVGAGGGGWPRHPPRRRPGPPAGRAG